LLVSDAAEDVIRAGMRPRRSHEAIRRVHAGDAYLVMRKLRLPNRREVTRWATNRRLI
jgi:hypothetical protein